MIRIFSFVCVLMASTLFSNPAGATVVSGCATINQNSLQTVQIEAQDKTIINWENFSIGPEELCVFTQPNTSSWIMNRVVGNFPSSLMGILQANGNVFLINSNGIVIGKDATIDVGGFLASTLDIRDEDFLNGGILTFENNTSKSLVNLGTVHASDGDIALLGYLVKNEGNLEARGNILVAAAEKILLKPGKENIFIESSLPQMDTSAPIGVENSGKMIADSIEIASDGNIYALAIKDSGYHDALAITEEGGKILLKAKNGDIETTGQFIAKNKNDEGGEIRMQAKNIVLDDSSLLDVSNLAGEGKILIGNMDIYDKECAHIFIHENAALNADATKMGRGGKIFARSEKGTEAFGAFSVKGGPIGGDGGYIDLSSKEGLKFFTNQCDISATVGTPGTLFFDPVDVVIDKFSFSSNPSWKNPYPAPGAYVGSAALNADDLIAALNSGSVTIDNTSGVIGNGGEGNTTINRSIIWNNSSTLNISAYKNINVNAPIQNTKEKSNSTFINFTTARGGEGNIIIKGAMNANCESSTGPTIHMEADKNIEILAPITLQGQPEKNSDPNIVLNSVNGDIKIQNVITTSGNHELEYDVFCASQNGLIVGGADNQDGKIVSSNGGNIFLQANNDLSILGGISSNGEVLLTNGGNCTLQSLEGNIVIQSGKGNISNASAVIMGVGNILIDAEKGNFQLLGNTAQESNSFIEVGEGDLTIKAAKDFSLWGGSSSNASSNSYLVNHSTQTGSINIEANNIILQTEPSVTGASSIVLENGNGSINITAQDNFQMKGDGQDILISSNANNAINIQASSFSMEAKEANAQILFTGDQGNVNIASPGISLLGNASILVQGNGASCCLLDLQGKDLILNAITGKNSISIDNPHGSLKVQNGTNINLIGGSLDKNSSTISLNGGDLLLGDDRTYLKGNLILQEGTGQNSVAKIENTGGNITVYAEQDINILGYDTHQAISGIFLHSNGNKVNLYLYVNNLTMLGGSTIQTDGSSAVSNNGYASCIIEAVNNITLGGANASALAQILVLGDGDAALRVIAGKDVILKNYSSMKNLSNGKLEVVADNFYPSMPFVGNGGIHMEEASSLEANHNVLLYTGSPDNTLISGTINGAKHFSSPVDTDQHHYFAYYPSPHLTGGPGFICFYKTLAPGLRPGGILFNAIYEGQIAATEMFYRLDHKERMFSIDPFNYYIQRMRSFKVEPLEPLSEEEIMLKLLVQDEIQNNAGKKL